jgi:quercetin dioxygenase-like cupin family protein
MKHTQPVPAEITPAIEQRISAFREKHANDELGGVASRVVFEDARVRIWEMTLEPGECSDLHVHEHDYYLAILSGDLVAGVGRDDFGVWHVPEGGNTIGLARGATEWAFNVGEVTYREILIELKDT